MNRLLIPLMLLTYLGTQFGCTGNKTILPARPAPLSESLRNEIKTVGVTSAGYAPVVYVQSYDQGTDSEAGSGAGEGAIAGSAVGAAGAMALLPLAVFFPPMLFVASGMFLVSTAGGAAVGGLQGQASPRPVTSRYDAELLVRELVRDFRAHEQVQELVVKKGRKLSDTQLLRVSGLHPTEPYEILDVREASTEGFSNILTVHVEQIVFTAEKRANPVIALDMSVRSTVQRTSDSRLLDNRVFTCRAGKQRLSDWRANRGTPFEQELNRCYQKIADRLIEEVFLVYVPSPSLDWGPNGGTFTSGKSRSLQPSLQWPPFSPSFPPTPPGIQSAAGIKAWPVLYDLKIWKADQNNLPSQLVYSRYGVEGLTHQVETPLHHSTTYFWTVRARFEVDGKPRVTPWAVTQPRRDYRPDTLDRVTNPFYFKLTTPSASTVAQQ